MSFFDELNRRNVFRAGIAYGVTAWLIAQIAGLSADSFGAPEWVMKMLITILVLGFPVAMVLAWAYDMTPQGLQRDTGDGSDPSVTAASGKSLDRIIIVALVAALAYFAWDKFVIAPKREAALLESAVQQAPEAAPTVEPSVTGPTLQDESPSIAVLPFVNMSDDANNEYFSEGLSEELLNLLVRIPGLKVAARTSSFSYKGKDIKIAQVGKELNVAHVLEGSVRKSGNQLRITAQLIKADDGFHIWSQTYDRTLDNIFQIQDEIAAAVVDGLKISLLGDVPVVRETDPEVYSLYLQGKFLITAPRGNEEDLERGVLAFEQALAIDPGYTTAWIGLAWAYESQTRFGVRSQDEKLALIYKAVDKALSIDENMALAWSTLAYTKKKYEWDWQTAREAADKALQLEPNNLDVLLGVSSVAGSMGQLDRYIELRERAVALDPLTLDGMAGLARAYLHQGRYDEGLRLCRQALVLDPDNFWAQVNIAMAHVYQGELDRALAELGKLPVNGFTDAIKARIFFMQGKTMESQALVGEFLNGPAEEFVFAKAQICAWRGDNDSAFEFLERAFEQREDSLANILTNQTLSLLKTDPRYPVFLEKLGLRKYWEAMPPEYGGPAP